MQSEDQRRPRRRWWGVVCGVVIVAVGAAAWVPGTRWLTARRLASIEVPVYPGATGYSDPLSERPGERVVTYLVGEPEPSMGVLAFYRQALQRDGLWRPDLQTTTGPPATWAEFGTFHDFAVIESEGTRVASPARGRRYWYRWYNARQDVFLSLSVIGTSPIDPKARSVGPPGPHGATDIVLVNLTRHRP
jgi:hypothetical protein